MDQAIEQIGMVVEGINALPAVMKLAQKYSVEMPIVDAVDAVCSGKTVASAAISMLISRELKSELSSSAFNQV